MVVSSCRCEYIRLKSLYFFFFGALGGLLPYIPVFYESLSFSKTQIGILGMLPNMGNIVFGPVCSILGDMFHAHYELMFLSIITCTILTMAMPWIRSFYSMFSLVLASSFARAPFSPQIDSLVMSMIPNRNLYGDMRLWGAVSFGIFSFLGGILTEVKDDTASTLQANKAEHDSFMQLFYLFAFCNLAGTFVLLSLLNERVQQMSQEYYRRFYYHEIMSELPLRMNKSNTSISTSSLTTIPSNSSQPSLLSERKDSMVSTGTTSPYATFELDVPSLPHHPTPIDPPSEQSVDTLSALRDVFRQHPQAIIFGVIVFLSGFGSGVIESFLFLRLKQLGASGYVLGISRFIMCAAEIPMFPISGQLHARYGTWFMLAFTQCAFVIRFVYYSWLTIPWLVFPCEVLHGVTFATLWNVSCAYANYISPPECHSTMQTLLEGLHWGLGSGLGALIGGFVYDYYGAVWLFEMSGVFSACSLVLAMGMYWQYGNDDILSENNNHAAASSTGSKTVEYSAVQAQSEHGHNTAFSPFSITAQEEEQDEEEGER